MIERTSRTLIFLALAAIVGGCNASPPDANSLTQAPTVVTSTPPPSLMPSASSVDTATLLGRRDLDRPLPPGSYRIEEPFDVPFSIAFPTEWTLKSLSEGDVSFVKTDVNGNYSAWITIDRIETVYDDPCHGGPIVPAVAQTVDGIITALISMVGFTPGPVSEVVIGGSPGKAVELRNTIDTETAACKDGRMLPMWTFDGGTAATNGGSRENIWVIEVDGSPLLIDGTMFIPGTPEASRAEIQQIVETLRFGSAAPAPVPSAAASPTPTPSPTGPYLTYVALGDSLLYALESDCDSCTSAAVIYGARAQEDLGVRIDVHNLTMHNGLTSVGLLDYLANGARIGRHEEDVFTVVAAADIISVTIGFNDIESPNPQYLADQMAAFAVNLDGILDRIEALRAGKPTAVLLTQIYNNGGPTWKSTVEAQNKVICKVAAEHDATCVDIYGPFNGADGLSDPFIKGYLGPDRTHPSQAGMDVIAAALAESGYAPLR
jgi:lysophospholipase L1-like esterase